MTMAIMTLQGNNPRGYNRNGIGLEADRKGYAFLGNNLFGKIYVPIRSKVSKV